MHDLVDSPERELELAQAAIERFDLDATVAHLSSAIRGFTQSDLRRQAAMACVRLGDVYANYLGNQTAGRAWFARATRLVESEPPCIEQGWVAVAAMGCDVDDPDVLLASAELALDRARRFSDVNLETKALADAGLAHVQAGRLSRGMALLDEAMALACGSADDIDTAGKSVCSFFTACYFTADFDRASSWAELLRRRGLIGDGPGAPIFLSNHCDSVHATLLVELGRWSEADAVLTRAITDFEGAMGGMPSWHPAIALAELRIHQQRLSEAEALLLGKDDHLQALLPAARLHLARSDYDLARATARRGLRAIRSDRVRAAELLAVLVDTELGSGNLDAATEALAELDRRTSGLDLPPLQARTAAVRSRVLAAAGNRGGAIAALEAALDGAQGSSVPWLRATLRLALARLRRQDGDDAGAIIDARAARSLLVELDVVLAPEDAAVLDALGLAMSRAAPETAMLRRDDRWWVATCGSTRARVPDTKGLRYLAELLATPGVERHALDLVDRVEGVPADGSAIERRRLALGDAGEVLDRQARSAYRRRIEELRSEIDDTLAAGSEREAEALQGELDQLVAQLARAFGLGGRSRRASSVAERARVNVTRALRSAVTQLAEALPVPGAVLDCRLRTGLYCAYEPADGDEVRWVVHS